MNNVDKIMKSMYGRSFGESSVTRKFDIDKYIKVHSEVYAESYKVKSEILIAKAEGFGDTVKKIWAKIKVLIEKLILWVKEAFNRLLSPSLNGITKNLNYIKEFVSKYKVDHTKKTLPAFIFFPRLLLEDDFGLSSNFNPMEETLKGSGTKNKSSNKLVNIMNKMLSNENEQSAIQFLAQILKDKDNNDFNKATDEIIKQLNENNKLYDNSIFFDFLVKNGQTTNIDKKVIKQVLKTLVEEVEDNKKNNVIPVGYDPNGNVDTIQKLLNYVRNFAILNDTKIYNAFTKQIKLYISIGKDFMDFVKEVNDKQLAARLRQSVGLNATNPEDDKFKSIIRGAVILPISVGHPENARTNLKIPVIYNNVRTVLNYFVLFMSGLIKRYADIRNNSYKINKMLISVKNLNISTTSDKYFELVQKSIVQIQNGFVKMDKLMTSNAKFYFGVSSAIVGQLQMAEKLIMK